MCRLAGAAGPFFPECEPDGLRHGLGCSRFCRRVALPRVGRTPNTQTRDANHRAHTLGNKGPGAHRSAYVAWPAGHDASHICCSSAHTFSARARLHTCAAAAASPRQGLAGDAGCGGAGEHARPGHTWARRARCARRLARRAQGCHGRGRERARAGAREREREGPRERARERERGEREISPNVSGCSPANRETRAGLRPS